MDCLSGAASIITVIGLALSSTQTIYHAVSNIRDGPRTIQQMLSGLQTLSSLLTQLLQSSDSFYLAADLQELVQGCATNLKKFEEQLGKLSLSADNKAKKLWKHAKVMLGSKDLERMASLIQQDVAALALQIQIIEGRRGSSQTMSLERIEALSNRLIALDTSNSSNLGTVVTAVNDNVKNVEATLEISNRGTSELLDQLGDKMQDLTGLSTQQSHTLNTIFDAILDLQKHHVSEKSRRSVGDTSWTASTESHQDIHGIRETRQTFDKDEDSIRECLDRLCQLAEETEKTIYSEDAETIIDDLQRLFDILSKAEHQSTKDRKGKRRRESSENITDDEALQHQREVKRMKSLLTTSQCIALNGKVSRPLTVKMEESESKKTRYQVQSSIGTMSVRAHQRRRIASSSVQTPADNLQADILEFWDAHVIFSSNKPCMAQVAITFQQQILHHGSFLTKPILSISALLPEDSKVFQLIKKGDLKGLRKSLSLRESRLTDRDLDGRCLLNYALDNTEPEICKYLIEQGADVDFIEPDFMELECNRHFDCHSLRSKGFNDCEGDTDELASVNQCRRLLLAAGADPTSASAKWNDEAGSFIEHVLSEGTTDSLQLTLDYASAFIGTSDVMRSENLLHYHLQWKNWTVESVALLLRRSGTQELTAQNLTDCLHSAVCGSFFADESGLRRVLILLIEAGADIYERDRSGATTSDIVCCQSVEWADGSRPRDGNYWLRHGNNHDLRLAEIWVEALNACGLDGEEIVSHSLRPKHLSDIADDSGSSDEDDASLQESELSIVEDLNDASETGSEAFNRCSYETPGNPYEQALLEGDAQVWQS